MSEEYADEPEANDELAPKGPLNLLDWAALYPSLPLQTVALSFAEAHNAGRFRDIAGDRNDVVARLITARLEEFSARRRGHQPHQPTR